jgi:hypothetical protein
LVPNGIPDHARDANAAGVGQRCKAHGDAAAVIVDLGAGFEQSCDRFDGQCSDSAAHQIVPNCRYLTYADAERNASIWCYADIAIGHTPLHLDCALYRLGRAGELDQQTVTGCSYDATVMLRDLGVCEVTANASLAFRKCLAHRHR